MDIRLILKVFDKLKHKTNFDSETGFLTYISSPNINLILNDTLLKLLINNENWYSYVIILDLINQFYKFEEINIEKKNKISRIYLKFLKDDSLNLKEPKQEELFNKYIDVDKKESINVLEISHLIISFVSFASMIQYDKIPKALFPNVYNFNQWNKYSNIFVYWIMYGYKEFSDSYSCMDTILMIQDYFKNYISKYIYSSKEMNIFISMQFGKDYIEYRIINNNVNKWYEKLPNTNINELILDIIKTIEAIDKKGILYDISNNKKIVDLIS